MYRVVTHTGKKGKYHYRARDYLLSRYAHLDVDSRITHLHINANLKIWEGEDKLTRGIVTGPKLVEKA